MDGGGSRTLENHSLENFSPIIFSWAQILDFIRQDSCYNFSNQLSIQLPVPTVLIELMIRKVSHFN
jgi:hypothetical protein